MSPLLSQNDGTKIEIIFDSCKKNAVFFHEQHVYFYEQYTLFPAFAKSKCYGDTAIRRYRMTVLCSCNLTLDIRYQAKRVGY